MWNCETAETRAEDKQQNMKEGTGWECFRKGEREPWASEMCRISESTVSSSAT